MRVSFAIVVLAAAALSIDQAKAQPAKEATAEPGKAVQLPDEIWPPVAPDQPHTGPAIVEKSRFFATHPATAAGGDGCGDGIRRDGESCGDACLPCCDPRCVPRWKFFGEFLYLRPRNAEVAYGVPYYGPVDPPPDVPVQVAREGVVDFRYEPGFRVGFERAVNDRATLGASYTYFDADTSNAITTDAPYVIRSMVAHPQTLTAASDSLDANAAQFLKFHLADLDYRWTFLCNERYSLSFLGGVRYGFLEQDFRSQFLVNGQETVHTNIRFEGGGIRIGLEGERRSCRTGLLVYGRGVANFMAGDTRATYTQAHAFAGTLVDTGWKGARIVDMLDLELGIGWMSPKEHLRFTAGYMISSWQNLVKTNDFIHAVQTNDFGGLHDTLTFDGLVVRAELRF